MESLVQTICAHCGLYEFVSKEREALPDGEYGTYVEVPTVASEEEVQEKVSTMITLFAENLLCKHARFIDKLSNDPLCQMRTIGIKCRVQDGELIFNLREGYNNEFVGK